MDILISIVGQIVVDHQADLLDVDAAKHDVITWWTKEPFEIFLLDKMSFEVCGLEGAFSSSSKIQSMKR